MPKQQPEIEKKVFKEADISRGISKLQRRINDIDLLDPRELVHDEAKRETVENSIRDTVRDIFGPNSSEAFDFTNPSLYYSDNTIGYWDDDDSNEWINYGKGIPQMETRLRGLIAKLEDKRLDLVEDPNAQVFQHFQGMHLHSRIAGVSSDLLRDGHYSNAVFDAAKALVNFVKERSGRHDLDGVGLMTEVFSVNNPVLQFNDLEDASQKDEQQGMMHLFMGAALAVRNPRGHSFLSDTPEEALEFIGLLSLLANRLERSRKGKGYGKVSVS